MANSRGINVWCASAGGHLTNHDVISVLKTSRIEKLVNRKEVILPQLAAAGVEAKVIEEKTRWKIIWGPVYAEDIPAFLKNKLKKEPRMREIKFPWSQRLEMAIAWAFPVSVLFSIFFIFFWKEWIIPTVLLTWGLSLLIFLFFPLYQSLLGEKTKKLRFIFFDFDRGGFQLILWGIFLICLTGYGILSHHLSWRFFLRWGFLSFIIVLVLSIDLKGSTPLYKGSLSEERQFKVVIDRKKCQGAGFCEDVCPRNCFKVDKEKKNTIMPRAVCCMACGACVIQCPHDALKFRNPKGKEIFPESLRKYKQNLMGKRIRKV